MIDTGLVKHQHKTERLCFMVSYGHSTDVASKLAMRCHQHTGLRRIQMAERNNRLSSLS
uniref:Uncharacterized protein n=1 Tax=Anguilla anguilla TaxID=7936 RepID=A0A0E9W2X7_ANGAN